MTAKIRVAILEDHQSTIDGYLYRLKDLPQFEVVAIATFGDELDGLLKQHPADVALLDVNVPTAPNNPNSYPLLYVIPRLLQSYPHMTLLVISMLTERALIQAVIDAGASGYILKDDRAAIENLGSILNSVVGGGIYLSEQAHKKLAQRQTENKEPVLTPRQLEAVSLAAAYPDDSLSDIANKLGVSNSTVRNLLSNAYLRLAVGHRAAAVAKARQMGLITPDELSTRRPEP